MSVVLIAAGLVVVAAVALLLCVASIVFAMFGMREQRRVFKVLDFVLAVIFALSAIAWLLLGVSMVTNP